MSHLKKYTFISKYFRLAFYFIHMGEVQIFFFYVIHCSLIHSDSNIMFILFGGAFTRKVQKVTFLLCVSVCLSTWHNTVSTRWHPLINFDFDQNLTK